MPPGYVPMQPPGVQGLPVYAPPQQLAQASAHQQPQRPVVRGSAPEEKKPARREPVSLPSPEQIGITPPALPDPNVIDWNATHERMKAMGVLEFQMPQRAESG